MMLREGVRTCRKKPIWLERQDQGRQYKDEGTEPQRQVHERRKRLSWKYLSIDAEKTSCFSTISAENPEIADLSADPVLLARSESSVLRFPPPLSSGNNARSACPSFELYDSVASCSMSYSSP